MSRPIDAVHVLNDINWHHRPTPVSEFESGFNQGLNQAMWIITHAPTLTPQNEWVSVDDALPKSIINKVLVYCENGYIGYGHYEEYQGEKTWFNLEAQEPFETWDIHGCGPYKVTHWMPLPAPPGEDNNVPANESLTLKQLLEMDGQPVYIISKAHTISEWNIPKGVGEIVIAYDVPCAGMKSVIPSVEFIDGKNLSVERYGSDWVAYRRPPEGEEDTK